MPAHRYLRHSSHQRQRPVRSPPTPCAACCIPRAPPRGLAPTAGRIRCFRTSSRPSAASLYLPVTMSTPPPSSPDYTPCFMTSQRASTRSPGRAHGSPPSAASHFSRQATPTVTSAPSQSRHCSSPWPPLSPYAPTASRRESPRALAPPNSCTVSRVALKPSLTSSGRTSASTQITSSPRPTRPMHSTASPAHGSSPQHASTFPSSPLWPTSSTAVHPT